MSRGVDPVETLTLLRGDWHCGYDPYERNVAPQSTPLATQLLHAVGVAHAARLKGEDTVVHGARAATAPPARATSTRRSTSPPSSSAPVVFFVQNNEYAISVPLAQQTAAPSLAHKGVGYGMPGERVDGNDWPALLAVLGRAVERARGGRRPAAGRGAHLPDAGAHQRRRRHPLPRRRRGRRRGWSATRSSGCETYLTDAGLLDDDQVAAAVAGRGGARLPSTLRDGLSRGRRTPDPAELFAARVRRRRRRSCASRPRSWPTSWLARGAPER